MATPTLFPWFMEAQAGGVGGVIVVSQEVVTMPDEDRVVTFLNDEGIVSLPDPVDVTVDDSPLSVTMSDEDRVVVVNDDISIVELCE